MRARLTIGYRSSLTEVVQIIGRARTTPTASARFTNLIAEPTAERSAVAEAVNDMLKAISASLLMEQVLAPLSSRHATPARRKASTTARTAMWTAARTWA